jgi:DNA-binding NtrC family response regulator
MVDVLSVGFLQDLLQTRNRALLAAGYNVASATTIAEAMEIAENGRCQVMILGHGIPESDRNAVTRSVKQLHPEMKVIYLYVGSIDNAQDADAVLSAEGSHQDLVNTVRYLVSKQAAELRGSSAANGVN